jgi:hypothetical protein
MGDPRPRRLGLWIGVGLGAPVMAFGIGGLLHDAHATRPMTWLRWFAEFLILHDGFLVPATIVAGVLLSRLAPAQVRAPIQVAAIVTVPLALASIPVLGGYGRLANNPSLVPLHYGRNLAIVLGGVWLVAVIGAASRLAPRQRHRLGAGRGSLRRN